MALYKVLCAVAVTIFLAPNGCLSQEFEMEHMSDCGLGGPNLPPENMTWTVEIRGTDNLCAGTLISSTKVLTSCSCNGSLDQVELVIGPHEESSEASMFEVFFGDEEFGADHPLFGDMDDTPCVYILQKPSNMTPICPPGEDSYDNGMSVLVGECESEITGLSECNITYDSEDQLCAVFPGNTTCEVNDGSGVAVYDKKKDRWRLAGIAGQADLNENDTIAILKVSFPDNDNMTVDFNSTTPPLFGTHPPDFTPDFTPDFPPDFTPDFPKPPTKCPKPHPPMTKPPCGCEGDGRDDSVFGGGVMMHSSSFILFCVLVISLYSTYC